MNRDVIGLITLDGILGFFFAGAMRVAFEFHIGNDFLHDGATNPACFRIPLDVVTAFERLGHLCAATESNCCPAKQWSRGKHCQ